MYLFKLWFSLTMCPGVGLLDHMATLFLVSEEPRHFFPWWLHQLTFPPSSVGEFPFSTLRGIYLIPEYEHVYSNLRRKKKKKIPFCHLERSFISCSKETVESVIKRLHGLDESCKEEDLYTVGFL